MKAFISGVMVAVLLAVSASYVLEGYLSVPASRAFAMPDVRVGHEVTVEGAASPRGPDPELAPYSAG